MPKIELVWDDDCPHVDAARENLAAALSAIGAPARWDEWRRDDRAAPPYASLVGSPAILIDGRDVEGHEAGPAACCRVYVGADGRRSAAPSVTSIVDALREARARVHVTEQK
jgi:hypothetical protein